MASRGLTLASSRGTNSARQRWQPHYSAIMSAPRQLSLEVDPGVKTFFMVWKPKKFAYRHGTKIYPNPGHSALVQVNKEKVHLLVNNQPDKQAKSIESLKATLHPPGERFKGTEMENLLIEEQQTDVLDSSLDISYFLKPSGRGWLLDSFDSFNQGHTLHIVVIDGFPRIRLDRDLMKMLTTYALKDNNCHHATLSSYIRGFKLDDEASSSIQKVVGSLYSAEVMMALYQHSVMFNTLPGLSLHRRLGLRSERRSLDLDSTFGPSFAATVKELSEKYKDRKEYSERRIRLVEELCEEVLGRTAPSLLGALKMDSNKEGNPQLE